MSNSRYIRQIYRDDYIAPTSKTYVGKECVACGDTLRYSSSNGCVTCKKELSKAYYRKEGKDAQRLRMYNVPQDYDLDRPCDLCGVEQSEGSKAHHIDHCHSTDKVRGILCHSCNIALGFIEKSMVNNPDLLRDVEDYLG